MATRKAEKAIGLDWQKKSNFTRASGFFVHFFAVGARLRRENALFHACQEREQKTTTFFLFSWTLIQSFRIQLQKNWTSWNKHDNVRGSANSLF